MGKATKKPAAVSKTAKNKATTKDKDSVKGPLQTQVAALEAGVGAISRDKGKGEKWSKLRSQGLIEPHILDMYDHPPSNTSKRQYRTDLINQLFERQDDGSLLVRADNSFFQQHKEMYEDRFSTDKEKMTTKLVFVGKNFSNDMAAFDRAMAAGEIVQSIGSDGVEYFGFKAITKGVKKGAKESVSFQCDKAINKKDIKAIGDMFAELKWKYCPSNQDRKQLEDGKLPESATKLLAQAVMSQEKLCKTAMSLLKQDRIPDQNKNHLKKGYAVSQKHMLTMQHVKTFGEFPEGDVKLNAHTIDKFMVEVATSTKQFNEDIHVVQGLLKARKA